MTMLLAARTWHYKLGQVRGRLLMAICDSAEDDGTGCTASEAYLSWKTELGLSTIYRTLDKLEADGIISRTHLADGRREITVFLENATLKPAWERRRRGRPRSEKNPSQGEKITSTAGNAPKKKKDRKSVV